MMQDRQSSISRLPSFSFADRTRRMKHRVAIAQRSKYLTLESMNGCAFYILGAEAHDFIAMGYRY
jgi:hypothetical protein